MRVRKDPQVRKQEIIEGSTALFLENGYEKTTVEHILNKLGIARGCFYHYFDSKEAVFAESIVRISTSLIDKYTRILESRDKSARERLLEYILFNFKATEEQQQMLTAVHSQEFEDIHEKVVKESIRQMLPVFIRLIEEGQLEGDFRCPDAQFAALALLGAFREIHAYYSHRLPTDMRALQSQTIELAERILQARHG